MNGNRLLCWALEWFDLDEQNPESERAFLAGSIAGLVAGLALATVIVVGLPLALDLVYP